MSRTYLCSHCNELLNPGSEIVLIIEHEHGRGLLLLSGELGDYTVVHGQSFPLVVGRSYVFRCPVCHADLTSPVDEALVELHSRDMAGRLVAVNFSRIYGEHATFVRNGSGLTSYGEHAARYEAINFFGAGDAEGE
jgi:hypothetical protein